MKEVNEAVGFVAFTLEVDWDVEEVEPALVLLINLLEHIFLRNMDRDVLDTDTSPAILQVLYLLQVYIELLRVLFLLLRLDLLLAVAFAADCESHTQAGAERGMGVVVGVVRVAWEVGAEGRVVSEVLVV